jgi:hypothetical protein
MSKFASSQLWRSRERFGNFLATIVVFPCGKSQYCSVRLRPTDPFGFEYFDSKDCRRFERNQKGEACKTSPDLGKLPLRLT